MSENLPNDKGYVELIKQCLVTGYRNIFLIYILFLSSILLPPLFLVAGALAFINVNTIDDHFLNSHYDFLFKSFWKFLVAISVAICLIIFAVGIILLPLIYLLFLIRIIVGMKYFLHNSPHPNPSTNWIQ